MRVRNVIEQNVHHGSSLLQANSIWAANTCEYGCNIYMMGEQRLDDKIPEKVEWVWNMCNMSTNKWVAWHEYFEFLRSTHAGFQSLFLAGKWNNWSLPNIAVTQYSYIANSSTTANNNRFLMNCSIEYFEGEKMHTHKDVGRFDSYHSLLKVLTFLRTHNYCFSFKIKIDEQKQTTISAIFLVRCSTWRLTCPPIISLRFLLPNMKATWIFL